MTTATAKFEDNFWGEGNHGFEVLLQNLKAQTTATKELGEYVKERALVEDGYVKNLSKLYKTISAVSEAHFGAFTPMWKLVRDTNEQLSTIHSQFCKMLGELAKEITEYNISQKDKMRTAMRGEIDSASDSLIAFGTLEGQVHRTKKQYQHGVEHLTKAQEKLQKALADPSVNPKTKQHLESKAKQAQTWMQTMKSDHQTAVKRQCEQLMEFQGKMKEACMKFEALEEEHLAQMSTFMLKLARSQNSTLVNVEQHYAAFNSHLDDLSVEKLLLEFVQAKGTGTEKPRPYKFRLIEVDVPPVSLSTSSDDIRSSSPTPGSRNTSWGEKSIIHRFKKKKPKPASNGPIEEHNEQPENAPEVDEEGYSIRPDNAASISQFPDEPPSSKQDSDSDSDFEDDEPESRIKSIRIKDTAVHPQATADELKASVMSLRLGATSPGIRKATSTHSLNALGTPPITKKEPSTGAKKQPDDSKSVSSLLDLDDLITGQGSSILEPTNLGGGATGLPPPLLPSSLFNVDPTATLTPMSVQPSSTQSSGQPTSSLSSSILSPTPTTSISSDNLASASSTNPIPHPGGSPRPIPKPRTTTFKSTSQKGQKDLFSSFEEVKSQPSSAVGGGAGEGGTLVPPLPNKKRKSTGALPSSSQSAPNVAGSTTTASGGSVTKSTSGYSVLSITSEKAVDSSNAFESNFGSSNTQDGTQTASAENRNLTGSLSAGSSPKMSTKFAKDVSKEQPSVASKDIPTPGILPLPLPAPKRGGPSSRRRSSNPPPGIGADLTGQVSSPLATAKMATPRSTSTSPISFTAGAGSTSNGLATSPLHATSSSVSPTTFVPIAVAIQETCHAVFKGNDMNKCVIKVTGEVMISFPANYIGQLGSHDTLVFKLSSVDSVERLLHNQHLLQKEGDGYSYRFDMTALVANLKQMREKQNSPYCNIQILKYEVKASSGTHLPLKLVSFWKCEPSMTNFRLDYQYQSHNLKQAKKPPMTNISVVVPVSGGVRKSLSKPEGSWVAEQNRIMWKLGDISEDGRGTLHAKFDVANGPTVPAPATVQFVCDGATMSGLTFELSSDAYKVSLIKNKCLSGKYTAEIVHHY